MSTAATCQNRLFTLFLSMALVVLTSVGAAASSAFVYALRAVDTAPNQVYGFRLDPTTGALTLLPGFPIASGGNGAGAANSECVAYDAVNSRLYVINDGSDTLSAFAVNRASGALTPLPFSPITLGPGAWGNVEVHPSGSPVAVGSGNGTVASFVVTATTATAASGSPYPTTGATPFSGAFSRDGSFFYIGGNLGVTIAGFSVTAATGIFTPLSGSPFNSGSGNPVGYATDSSGRLFSVNAAANQVRVFTIGPGGVPTGVAGNPFSAGGLAVGVAGVLHPSGFYMVADRGGKVGVYAISGSGSATTLSNVSGSPFSTGGIFTDALALTPEGGLLVAANGGSSHNLTVFSVNAGTGSLTSLFLQPANTLGTSGIITGVAIVPSQSPPSDFDGDGKTDLSVWRPSNGNFYWLTSSSGYNYAAAGSKQWGIGTQNDVPLTGDIDGDGKADVIVWRPGDGTFYWLTSSSGYNYAAAGSKQWGTGSQNDTPLIGDIDGDGKADLIVWRPGNGTFYWLTSSSGYNYAAAGTKQWGTGSQSDTPLIGDIDGDGKTDLIVWRPGDGTFYWLTSSSGYSYAAAGTKQWGTGSQSDTPLLGDVDGDGKADLIVWRPGNGTFYWLTSSSGYNYATAGTKQWGAGSQNDTPQIGDIDGDGKADLIVWRRGDGTFYWLTSSSGYSYAAAGSKAWGTAGDIPLIK